ncbi:rho GTPase-activating protein 27-like isoform X2 [Genypterus blacodes]|uniref:rho GTPase-activating protein 27-like isoform X2 n=1 Tax=Genypterus blacodes TaxID=154954 RepID=UPI003F762969
MTSSSLGRGLGLVLVEYEYEYPGRDGELVSIKPNERYVLLAKTNDHWWQVHRDHSTKPFYIPAKYVKELPLDFPSPLDLTEPPSPNPVLLTVATPVLGPVPKTSDYNEECSGARAKPGDEVMIRLRTDASCRKTENRMSTFGVPLDFNDLSPLVAPAQQRSSAETTTSATTGTTASADGSLSRKQPSLTGFQGKPLILDDQKDSGKPPVPSFSPADPLPMPRAHSQPIPVETPLVPVIPSTNNFHNSTSASLGHQENESPIEPDEEEEEEELGESGSENKEKELQHREDSNHIYESIQDLNLDLDVLVTGRGSSTVAPDPSSAPPPAEDVRLPAPDLPVYANVSNTKKPLLLQISDPSLPCPSAQDSVLSPSSLTPFSSVSSSGVLSPVSLQDGWQVHADQDTGKVFYYHPVTGQSTWCDPRSPPLQLSPASSQSLHSWEQLVDEASGKLYYYNPSSGATSWAVPEPLCPSDSTTRMQDEGPPPLPEEDYPTDDTHNAVFTQHVEQGLPRAHMSPPGLSSSSDTVDKVLTEQPPLHRLKSEEDRGKPWSHGGARLEFPPSSQTLMGNGVEEEGGPLQRFVPSHRRNLSDLSEPSSRGHSPQLSDRFRLRRNLSDRSTQSHQLHGHLLEKAGILNKTKVVDSGKKIRKNWSQSWTVLHGGILTFHKDPKSAPTGNASKTSQIVPDYTVELRGASMSWAPKDKSSKKHVLELKTRHGCEYLMQYDTESIICDWYKAILESIRQLEQEHLSEEEEDEASDKEDRKRTSWSGPADSEHSRVRTKLRRFLQRRPTLQSVKEKGYIRDNVFGCHLDTLCHRENTTVPKFVEKCIRAVERKGLDVDGIYRVSGNLAVIQKLRHRADHEEQLDLEDGQWEEIHVITGALKLFLRELPEPLFPFSCFNKFIAAIQVPDYSQRVSYMKDLVQALPLPHHNTMELLFTHLRRVIDHGESNRMSAQSVAIVFGPTLLRPQTESANMTLHMVFQSQIVELMVKEFQSIFSKR